MKFLILFTAIVLAAIAAYFSVYGLHKLFIGAGTSIIILGSILEASKLVTVAFLHQKWKEIGGILKTYLVFAVIVLMLITSLGIYGYLANGYNATAIKIEKYEQQIAENTDIIDSLSDNIESIANFDYDKYNQLIIHEQEQINKYNARLAELDKILEQIKISQTGFFKKKDDTYEKTQLFQAAEREQLANLISLSFKKIQEYKTSVGVQQNEKSKDNIQEEIERLRLENNELLIKINSTDIGTFRFVSKTIGLDTDNTVNLFILLIMFTFDPLAVSLVLCFSAYSKINTNDMKKEEIYKLNRKEIKKIADENSIILKNSLFKKKMADDLFEKLVKDIKEQGSNIDQTDRNFRVNPENSNS